MAAHLASLRHLRYPTAENSTRFGFADRLSIHSGIIRTIVESTAQTTDSDSRGSWLDCTDCTVLPGFIDIHIHGGDGVDVMDADGAALTQMGRFLVRHGVTGFMATTMTAPHAATLAAVQAVSPWVDRPETGARILGIHLEGPFLSPRYPGAQPASYIRPPDQGEFDSYLAAGPVKMMTLAPEQSGAERLIRAGLDAGVRLVLGHTEATYAQTIAAIGLGVCQATHTYNAMTGLHHRRPGVVGAVLTDDRIDAQLIADGIHVHPAAMAVLARCKGPQKVLLISDAMRATGLPPGRYDLGGQPVWVEDGQCRLADGTLAGSVLTMDVALRRFLDASGWDLETAWPVTSRNQARSLGLNDRYGSIAAGYSADLVVLDEKLEVVATLVGGALLYLRQGDEDRLTER